MAQRPKKIVGFEPSTSSQIFEFDEEMSSSVEEGTSALSAAMAASQQNQPVLTKISRDFSNQDVLISQKLDIESISVPSTKSLSQSRSFQERLFQKPPSVKERSTSDLFSANHNSQTSLDLPKKFPAKKALTKQERRELQEKQRAEKAAKSSQLATSKISPKLQKPLASSPPAQTMPRPVPPSAKKQYKKLSIPDPNAGKVVSLFSHLTQYDTSFVIASDRIMKGVIHPAVISLGVQIFENLISGGNARCIALVTALSQTIADYIPPSGTVLHRHLITHINRQVDYISNTRPLCASMKTLITFIKREISNLSHILPDEDAKNKLRESLSEFIETRIIAADNEIVHGVLKGKKIKNGDVILTFARSSIVLKLLLEAHKKGILFKVIVVDSRPRMEGIVDLIPGKDTLAVLQASGISCTYVTTKGVHYVMKEATKVIMGASSVLSNGDILSRVGTSLVAMEAHDARIPVMILCEIYKFHEMVRLDSFVWNEIGDPEELIDISNGHRSERMSSFIPPPTTHNRSPKPRPLSDWKKIENLKLLNLTYDITPAKFITMVVCELGQIPSTLALSILRGRGLE